jgi:enoyl-CoA hydratase/carnithine racemase
MTDKQKQKDSGPAIKVEYRSEDKIGIVSINRPSKMNAISFEMFAEFEKAIETLLGDATKEVRAIVLTGEG